jgi:rhodanese-related sulfurtransferase
MNKVSENSHFGSNFARKAGFFFQIRLKMSACFRQLSKFASRWTRKTHLPRVTDQSTLAEVRNLFPEFPDFLSTRYGVTPTPDEDRRSLQHVVQKYGLPPARIVFMELQLASRLAAVRRLSPVEANRWLAATPDGRVLDVRESWERRAGSLPRSRPLDESSLNEVLATWPKETPVLLYCHFGVRSLDAAAYLAQQGFTEIYTLQGGVDAWSQEVDESIPRYTGSWC